MWALIFTLWCLSKLMWAGPETDVGGDLKLMWAGTWNWCGQGPETKMQVEMALANYVCWRAHPVNMFSSSNVTAKPLVTVGKKVPITCVRSVMITTSITTVQMVCMGCGFTSGWPGWCLHLCSYEQNTGKKCYIESLSSVPKDKKLLLSRQKVCCTTVFWSWVCLH